MAKDRPLPVVHTYIEVSNGKFKGTKHYQLKQVENGTSQLSDFINISKNRNFALSKPDYWLKTKVEGRWSKKAITGLFKTGERFVYYGDENHRQHLIIFKFSDDATTLTILYYKNYYTRHLNSILHHLEYNQ